MGIVLYFVSDERQIFNLISVWLWVIGVIGGLGN